MAAFIAQNLAPVMFLALVAFLLLGYPVAFSLGAVGLIFFAAGVELAPLSGGAITLSWPLLGTLPGRVFGIVTNETLLAVPFFTFMGLILERSGMAEDLLDTVGQLFGTVRGGLAFAVIFVGALLAATTGVVAASVISMGLISLPIMLRYGYDRRLAAGVIAASGTLAQIIPPSLVLIVIADQLGRSVGDMYAGALVPGLLLTVFYACYVLVLALFDPKAAPGLPPRGVAFHGAGGRRGHLSLAVLLLGSAGLAAFIVRQSGISGTSFAVLTVALATAIASGAAFTGRVLHTSGLVKRRLLPPLAERVTFVMVPPLALIFLVLGTIFIGVATPTEGGAMGALGALLLAGFKRLADSDPKRLNVAIVRQAAEATATLSAFVMFILAGARIFSLTFYGVNGHIWVEHLLTSLPGGQAGFLLFVNAFVFVLAFFLDFFELAFIVIPLLAPAASALGIDLVWFGVMLAVNMQTSFMHPPFGFALFYLRQVAPKTSYADKVTGETMAPVTTAQIYWGAVPFVAIQVLMVGLVMAFPGLVLNGFARPAPAAAVESSPLRTAPAPDAAPPRGLALPPQPPEIEGLPPYPADRPGAPTLDLSVPPEIG